MTRREALITGVVVALTCLLITTFVVVAVRSDDDVVLDRSVEVGDDDEAPDPAAPVDELAAFVAEAIAFVEQVRGRSFLATPEVVVLGEDDFTARIDADLVADLTEDPEELAEVTAAYRALALIGPDDDLLEIVRAFGAAGILGFYDPETDELVIRQRDRLSLLTKSTIVHELAHAFDDQHFDLDREEYDDRTDEVPWTFRAVVEGTASWVESQWQATLTDTQRGDLRAEELSFADPSIFQRFSFAFLLYELSPYEHGEPFIVERFEAAGLAGIDEVLTTPPATSEQVMEPLRFAAREPARELEVPPADGEVVLDGVAGEALIDALLEGNGIRGDVEWGADQLVVWKDGDAACVRWDIRSDTVAGLADLEDDFASWARIVGGAAVERTGPETIRVDRCS